MEKIATEENLYDAWRTVRSNKGAAGVDAVSLRVFQANLEENLADLRQRLQDDTYYPLPLRRTTIPKKDGGERGLAIPTVADRVAQRAFVNVLDPLFDPVFLECSYGFRVGRSVEHAVQAVLRHRQEGYGWIVDADVEAFFDSVSHALLMERLRSAIGDRAVLRTIQMWLDVGVLTDGRASCPVGSASLLQTTANYVRGVSQEVVDHLLGRDAFPSEFDGWDVPTHEEAETAARQRALKRFGRDAVLLALTFRRALLPLLSGKALLLGGGLGAAALGATTLGKRWLDGRSGHSSNIGTPQGSPLSPLLANVYLHPFDTAMMQDSLRLVRYADDFVVCCASLQRARHALQVARRGLERLQLKVNESKTRIVGCEDEFAFLGHLFDGEGAISLHDGERLEKVREVLDALKHSARKSSRAVRQAGKRLGDKSLNAAQRFGENFAHDLKERWDEARK
jgi:RNA-directed DNA polymerase